MTLEPNTAFSARPPPLPADDDAFAMQTACAGLMREARLANYEISAWSRPGSECRHNLNYWRYGDFLGIGAGAHGKLTVPSEQAVRRRIRLRHPRAWMDAAEQGDAVAEDRAVGISDRVFEYFLNQLRLRDGVRKADFPGRTGAHWQDVDDRVALAIDRGLLEDHGDRLVATETGWRFVNEIQVLFLP